MKSVARNGPIADQSPRSTSVRIVFVAIDNFSHLALRAKVREGMEMFAIQSYRVRDVHLSSVGCKAVKGICCGRCMHAAVTYDASIGMYVSSMPHVLFD